MRYLHISQILNPVGTSGKEEAKEFTILHWFKAW